MTQLASITIDQEEINHFQKLANTWWDEEGPYKSLHQLNPLRLSYIKDHILKHFQKDLDACNPLKGLSILDIGCGGGLLCEPLTRLGAKVKGIDATSETIEVAKLHSSQMDLKIEYECSSAEKQQGTYDVVLCMEIVEHVADLSHFIKVSSQLVRPGGLIFLSTLNRTWKSYIFGIVAAEYILRWVPKGTHQWEKFVKPKELKEHLTQNNISPLEETGVILDPLKGIWTLSPRQGVNYMMVGERNHLR